jgi:hypothetical protein
LVDQLNGRSAIFNGMPTGAIYRLYGLICMEVFGQLHWALKDADAYFDRPEDEPG